MKSKKNVLNVHQAVFLLGIDRATLEKLVERQEIKTLDTDNRDEWHFDKESLKKFMERNNIEKVEDVFSIMEKFLLNHANEIQKLATAHHKKFLGLKSFRTEKLEKYQRNHMEIVHEFAKHLRFKDMKRGVRVFKKLGEKFARDSVKDNLTIEESVDGIIFIKQAVWQLMQERGILDLLDVKDFFQVSHALGTYCDVVTSKIAFSYHNHYTKKLEGEKQKVERAVQLRDIFISAASHELRTPITSLKVYLEGLKKHTKKHQGIESYFEKVDMQVRKVTTLIEDLLDITKMQQGRFEFTMKGFDLNELVAEAVEAIQGASPKHNIIILGKVGRQVFGDRDKLYQVITNLLTNAIKYSPKAEEVIVKLTEKDDAAVVSVEDFGIGITSSQRKKIFQQFYRVERRNEKTFPGMGMGLFIANEIIKRHGSTIQVTSSRGKGSIFSFSLPYSPVEG